LAWVSAAIQPFRAELQAKAAVVKALSSSSNSGLHQGNGGESGSSSGSGGAQR
jgi:hypothetical protein